MRELHALEAKLGIAMLTVRGCARAGVGNPLPYLKVAELGRKDWENWAVPATTMRAQYPVLVGETDLSPSAWAALGCGGTEGLSGGRPFPTRPCFLEVGPSLLQQ